MLKLEQSRPLAPKVAALAGYGLSADEIARVVDVSHDDLKFVYARELDSGRLEGKCPGGREPTPQSHWRRLGARRRRHLLAEDQGTLESVAICSATRQFVFLDTR